MSDTVPTGLVMTTIYELHPPGYFCQCRCCYSGCDCGCVEVCPLAKVMGYHGQSTFEQVNSDSRNDGD